MFEGSDYYHCYLNNHQRLPPHWSHDDADEKHIGSVLKTSWKKDNNLGWRKSKIDLLDIEETRSRKAKEKLEKRKETKAIVDDVEALVAMVNTSFQKEEKEEEEYNSNKQRDD